MDILGGVPVAQGWQDTGGAHTMGSRKKDEKYRSATKPQHQERAETEQPAEMDSIRLGETREENQTTEKLTHNAKGNGDFTGHI